MAAYTGIQGQNILIVSSDPANPTEGQIWYNSTTNLLKGYANVVTNAWASGGNLNTARNEIGSAGTQTANLVFGGRNSISPPITASNATESYNGTSWTTVPATLNTTRRSLAGCGTQTAALATGGVIPPQSAATEKYNGSTWTNTGSLNTARNGLATIGLDTAALAFGGATSTAYVGATESYNGSSWTTSPASLPSGRGSSGGAGTSLSGAVFGGDNYATLSSTVEWNAAPTTQTITTS